ncbi:facilitated trehalose transporter Tret1-like [Anthonomus grandis grandis]|uniref:facilitated trehalose transporter Tret1-like n=1 Tax=Anthonomus grandis grandis TaxID=2921223 RepID=UPI0021652ECE|nr:facilitated trehalose transporter Tret1-like [Anthonomus grandis grandis]
MFNRFQFDIRKIFGRRCYQYFAAVFGSLSILSSEMHFGWPSSSLPQLTNNGTYFIQVTKEESSWLAVGIFPGIVFGAILSNFLADKLGRKKIILLCALPLFISWATLAMANCFYVMFLARFLGGMGGGLSFSTVPMYLGEISEPQIRGFLSSLCPIFVVTGILLINLFGIYLPINECALWASSIPLLMFCTFFWMPESPVFLMTCGKYEQAVSNLKMLRGKEEGEKEYVRLTKDLTETMQEQKKGPSTFLDLFRVPVNRRALIIALGLRSVQQFCGSTAITFYCKSIFEEFGGIISGNSGTIIYFSLQMVLTIATSLVVDKFGRRPIFIVSLLGTTITLFMISIYLVIKEHTDWDLTSASSVPILGLLLNIVFFSIGVRNVPLLVMSEIFHPKIKPLALCFGTIYYGILAIVVTKFYNLTNELVEMACPMFVFAFLCLICLVVYYFFVPETKGKTLEDIQRMLSED